MSEQEMVSETAKQAKAAGSQIEPAKMARRVWLAGIGAVTLTRDEIEHLAKRCLERGEMAQKESSKLAGKAAKLPKKSWKSAEKQMDRQVDAVLDWLGILTKSDLERMNLPSRADIESLGDKVAALTHKVDQLRKAEDVQAREVAALRKVENKPEPVKN